MESTSHKTTLFPPGFGVETRNGARVFKMRLDLLPTAFLPQRGVAKGMAQAVEVILVEQIIDYIHNITYVLYIHIIIDDGPTPKK